jgi:Integrase zinc binding domain
MDSQQYYNLYNYLTYQQYPNNYTQQQQQQLQKQAKYFKIENNLLYKVNRNNSKQLLRVIQKHELSALLYMMHNDPTSEHFAVEAMYNKIKIRYYWPQFYEDIRKYVESCDAC